MARVRVLSCKQGRCSAQGGSCSCQLSCRSAPAALTLRLGVCVGPGMGGLHSIAGERGARAAGQGEARTTAACKSVTAFCRRSRQSGTICADSEATPSWCVGQALVRGHRVEALLLPGLSGCRLATPHLLPHVVRACPCRPQALRLGRLVLCLGLVPGKLLQQAGDDARLDDHRPELCHGWGAQPGGGGGRTHNPGRVSNRNRHRTHSICRPQGVDAPSNRRLLGRRELPLTTIASRRG